MSVPTISPKAAAILAKLTPDVSAILSGLDPVPLPSDKRVTATGEAAQVKTQTDPKKPDLPPPLLAAETARQTGAGRQTSIAPLIADLEQAIRNDVLPPRVRAAAEQVVKLQTPVDAKITPQTVKDAVSRSGLFLEQRLAQSGAAPEPDLKSALLVLRQVLRAVAPPTTPPASGAIAPDLPVDPTAPRPATAQSAAPQAPSAPPTAYAPPRNALPTFEAPLAGAPAQAPTTPEEASSLLLSRTAEDPEGVEGARPQTPPQTANTPSTAARAASPVSSGLGGGAQAAPVAPQGQTTPTPPMATAPAQTPAGALPPVAGQQPATAPPTNAAPPALQTPKTQAAQTALLTALPQAAEAKAPLPPSPLADPLAALKAVAEEGPSPPLKGAPPHAQRAAEPALSANADPAQVMRHLEKATSGAIARTELMQLASLPDAPRADGEVTRTQSWLFEMPVATPHGPAVAQFEIEKDGGGGADAEARSAAVWRTRFSVDVEPLGLIHALVTLSGGKTAVTLWAERRESLSKLRAAQAELAGTLEGEVAVYPGRPQAPAPREGRFLDSQS